MSNPKPPRAAFGLSGGPVAKAIPVAHEPGSGLPDFSGLDVLKLVRQLQATIPVIMITGTPDLRIAAEAMESGAFAYIPKPASVTYVENLVAAALRGG